MKGSTLIVSYPKSGSTWFRAFLTSALASGDDVDINNLSVINSADRNFCNTQLGLSSCDLSGHEFAVVRPRIYEMMAKRSDFVLKVHDSLLPPMPNVPSPFSADGITAVIYIVRDPRDVALSFADHLGVSVDDAITSMNQQDFVLGNPYRAQFPQYLGSWSMHVSSWLDASKFRIKLVRYEDMLADTINVLGAAMEFMGYRLPLETLRKAATAVSFANLKKQEVSGGFVEAPPHANAFFRAGQAGNWKAALSTDQKNRIVQAHHAVMHMLGYIGGE